MRFEDKSITSIGELINHLNEDGAEIDVPIWFRGQSDVSWKLQPKLMRLYPLPSESHLLNKFKQSATFILENKPANEFEWLFLMQHYGISTRLLDWTESPLVALYFALNEMTAADKDGALWVLLPTELNKLSNYKPEFASEIPSFEDEHLQNYLPNTIASERKSSLIPMAAIAPRNSSRMQSQLGVFTINHRENVFIEEAGHEYKHVWRYIIPKDSKEKLLKELSLLRFTKFQLFPELASLAEI